MKVKCVDNTDLSDVLTIGKVYDATPHDHHNDLVCVTDDSGKQAGYYATRFVPTLEFRDLEVGDYVYIRDDLESGVNYGYRVFVGGIDGMSRGCLLEVHAKKSHWISHEMYDYSKGMIDLSRSMKKKDYEKMQEKETVCSFEQLQQVAHKALKDGVISQYSVIIGDFGNENIIVHFDGKFTEYNACASSSAIDFIKSLYHEEFVINSMLDELRINSGANIILSNGLQCIYFDDGERKLRFDSDYYPCNFLVLKGATVKQSRK